MKSVCVLPGDGIGPEVVECAVRVLNEAAPDLQLVYADIGNDAMKEHGSPLPDSTLELMGSSDSSIFGAVTSVKDPAHPSPVLTFRRELDLFANVRPIRRYVGAGERSPVDLVIIRENSEGLYHQKEEEDEEGVTTFRRVTRRASERIVDFAIGYAKENGRNRICCVHKANVLRASDALFLNIFNEVMGLRAPGIEATDQLVDSAAMALVTSPSRFDIIVTLNLYGDILSDVAAGVIGGLGFAPSGNIGPKHSVFEPAHGSAPDIAGKGIANPTATILAAAMMLEHIGLREESRRVSNAVRDTYAAGHLTMDVGGRHGSASFTDCVLERLTGQGDRTIG
jgi:isopropylmalate/isohomocitrate dehydrogenase-like protein